MYTRVKVHGYNWKPIEHESQYGVRYNILQCEWTCVCALYSAAQCTCVTTIHVMEQVGCTSTVQTNTISTLICLAICNLCDFQLVAKVMHLLPIHASCKTRHIQWQILFQSSHSCLLSNIIGIAPATAVNIATPSGPQPSSTGNIVQFDDLRLCIVSDRRTINDVHV